MTKPSVCVNCGWFVSLENGVLKCGCWPLKGPRIEEDTSSVPPVWPDENMDAAIKRNINAALDESSINSLALYARDLLCRVRELEDARDRLHEALAMLAQVRHVSGSAQSTFRFNLKLVDAVLAGADPRKLEVIEAIAAGTWKP